MTVPLADLLLHTAARLSDDYAIDAGIKALVEEMQRAAGPAEAVGLAKKQLKTKVRALRAASHELQALEETIAQFAQILRFTDEGWPDLHKELKEQFEEDLLVGAGSYLDTWFTAVSGCRFTTLDRLEHAFVPPPEAALLVERCSTAAAGLCQRHWHASRWMLEKGAEGITVGSRTVPDAPVRAAIRLVIARLAVANASYEQAEAALRAVEDIASPATLDALRSRLFRVLGDDSTSVDYLKRAREDAPYDLDVIVELVEREMSEGRTEQSLETARTWVDTVPALHDIESELARLVIDAPAPLWIAIAERAVYYGQAELHARALERAQASTPVDKESLLAAIAEARAAGLEGRPEAVSERVASLIDAGRHRVAALQLEPAIAPLKRAHEIAPDNPDAALRLADCEIALGANRPSLSQERLEYALDLILEVQRRGDIDDTNAWSYLSEAMARQALARVLGIPSQDHCWRAVLAVCRSLAHNPEAPERWNALSDAASLLKLYGVARAAAAHALELAPHDEQSIAMHIQSLANAGRFREALDRVAYQTKPWHQAVRGWLLLKTGEPREAVRILRLTTIDPTWTWATQSLIGALLLSDLYEEARSIAEGILSRPDEFLEGDMLLLAGFCSLVLHRLLDAERFAERAHEATRESDTESHQIIGVARLLGGDAEGARAALQASIASATSDGELAALETIFLPGAKVLATQFGLTLPDIEWVSQAIAARRTDPTWGADEVTEMATVIEQEADSATVDLAKVLGRALLLLARNDPDSALASLDADSEAWANDAEWALLREYLVRRLADQDRAAVDTTLNGETGETSDAMQTQLATVPESGAWEPPGMQALRSLLPASWFDEFDDPVSTHSLFLRYIPEMRLRAGWSVPAIHVEADETLEPDRYQLYVLGELAEEGEIDPFGRYVHYDSLPLLEEGLRRQAKSSSIAGLARLPAEEVEGAGAWADLLTIPPTELVARRIGDLVQAHMDRLREATVQ